MEPFKTKFREQYPNTGFTATLAGLVGYMECLRALTEYINENEVETELNFVEADTIVTKKRNVIDVRELRDKIRSTSLELIEINKEITLNKLKTDL